MRVHAFVVLAACSTLPHIDANVCGNGIVEPGEDCDGAADTGACGAPATVNECHFVCDGMTACPSDAVCGHDGRCRAPTATFGSPLGPYAFAASEVFAGDVDGDGYDDLVGVHETDLGVRFGGATGELGKADVQTIPPPSTSAVLADLDGDGRADLMFGAGVGVFTFLGASPTLTAHAYASPIGTTSTGTVVLASAQVLPLAPAVVVAIGSIITYAASPTFICLDGRPQPCGTKTSADLLEGHLATGRTGFQFGAAVAADVDVTDEVVVAFAGDTQVAILSPAQPVTPFSLGLVQTLALPANTQLDDVGTAGFGQFEVTNKCVDLVVPVVRGNVHGLLFAYGHANAGGCTGTFDPFDPTVIPMVGKTLRAVVDINDDGFTDVVTSRDIEVTTCVRDIPACNGKWQGTTTTATPRPWSAVQVLDLNHDGEPDLAGIAAGDVNVDVMIGTGLGVFNPFPVPTEVPPRFIEAGDFDGDLFTDLAIITGDPTLGTDEVDRVSVVFGAPAGGPGTPVAMGEFDPVEAAVPASLFLDTQKVDAVASLALVLRSGSSRLLAELLGSSSRRMLAPLLLADGGSNDAPFAIAAGRFDAHAGVDLSILAAQANGGASAALLSGAGGGDLTGAAVPLGASDATTVTLLAAAGAQWRTLHSSAGAAMVGVGSPVIQQPTTVPLVVVIDPAASGAAVGTPASLPATYAGTRLRGIATADLDGDGNDELMIDLAAAGDGIPTGSTAIAWNRGGQLDVAHAQAISPDATCRELSPVQLDLDPALEVAALCGTSAVMLTLFDWDGSAWVQLAAIPSPLPTGRIVAGDFNGDGLADVAVVSAQPQAAFVLLQCAKGDPTCGP